MPRYKRYREFQARRVKSWWPGTESNRRHKPFQGSALPTELTILLSIIKYITANTWKFIKKRYCNYFNQHYNML